MVANRFELISNGLYPEVLPPCFVKINARAAFRGITPDLDDRRFENRPTKYTKYSGTKHDQGRRPYGTPNIVSYFHVSTFMWRHWTDFSTRFAESEVTVSSPQILLGQDRTVKVPSLSELSLAATTRLSYAPFLLKADIAQCFPSIYTHSIPWAKHGIVESKANTGRDSSIAYFNALDFHTQNCQNGQTRGLIIGPDAFRLVAEFILCKADLMFAEATRGSIVSAVRHVDDYYIGLKSEHDAQSVLTTLRNVLAEFELHLNDQKTGVISSLESINDLWAQRLRGELSKSITRYSASITDIERSTSETFETARQLQSDSPVKILLRHLDDKKVYGHDRAWALVEPILMRAAQKHFHALDYICLIIAKRFSIGKTINTEGWKEVMHSVISRNAAFGHTHEVSWSMWLCIVACIPISDELLARVADLREPHIMAMIIRATVEGRIAPRKRIKLGDRLSTVDEYWLPNLVAKSSGYSNARFSGNYSAEFSHLSEKGVLLLDFKSFESTLQTFSKKAISRTRYGYDDDGDGDGDGDDRPSIFDYDEFDDD